MPPRGRSIRSRAAPAEQTVGLLAEALRVPTFQDALLGLQPHGWLPEACGSVAALAGAGAVDRATAAQLWKALAAGHRDVVDIKGLPLTLGEGGLASWQAKGLQALCKELTLPHSGTKPQLLVRP